MTTAPSPALPPLLLVPGLMCDEGIWADLITALRGQGPVLADIGITVIDHGDADSLGAMAERLLAHAPPRFAIAGHSMGGRVALEVLRRAPQRVSHLGLFNTGAAARPAGEAGVREADQRMASLRLAMLDGVPAMARDWVQGMVDPARLASDPVFAERVVTMLARKTPARYAAQLHALLHRPDATELLRTVAVPTLLVTGLQDGFGASTPAQMRGMLAQLPPGMATMAEVDQAGHMAPMEQPEVVARAMADWLRL